MRSDSLGLLTLALILISGIGFLKDFKHYLREKNTHVYNQAWGTRFFRQACRFVRMEAFSSLTTILESRLSLLR